MAVPASVISAYAVYLDGMAESRRSLRPIQRFLAGTGDAGRERCQDDFVSAIHAAVDAFVSDGPEPSDAADTVRYILSRANENRQSGEAFWMLLASHVYALPLIDLLSPGDAGAILAEFEASYPKRERMPVQKTVIKALKARM